MTFKATTFRKTQFGNKRVNYGKFENDSGSSGGIINTELRRVESISLQHIGSTVVSNVPVVVTPLPADSPNIEIKTDANKNGLWIATGF